MKDGRTSNILAANPNLVFSHMMEEMSPEERDAFITDIFDALMEMQELTNRLNEIENDDKSNLKLDEQGKLEYDAERRGSIANIHSAIAIILINIVAANKAFQIKMAYTRLEILDLEIQKLEAELMALTDSLAIVTAEPVEHSAYTTNRLSPHSLLPIGFEEKKQKLQLESRLRQLANERKSHLGTLSGLDSHRKPKK